MSTVILLSSSPPQVFARSPTPADSSSPLPSVSKLLKNESPSRKKFKTTSAPRDGFPPAFGSAREVLVEKVGAQNKILATPLRNRFRSSQEDVKMSEKEVPIVVQESLRQSAHGKNQDDRPIHIEGAAAPDDTPQPMTIQITKKDVRRKPKQSNAPLMLQRATSRKIDWTPPKPTSKFDADSNNLLDQIKLPTGLLGNFGFHQPGDASVKFSVDLDKPAKRRKLDVTTQSDKQLDKVAKSLGTDQKDAISTTKKRNKSPTKKSLTITGLATSKFSVSEPEEVTPMMQYTMVPQNAPAEILDVDDELNAKAQKLKAVVKKLKSSKKTSVKTRLVSPSSAMMSFEHQEAIFGSASQLAGDESPTFLRDTIEAMRQSETNLLSDPASPPCPTQPISIESTTPKFGTSRFRKTRNLWSAADRDEDNALLHVETVDLTTMSAVRNAFAGKDALIQTEVDQSFATTKVSPGLRGGGGSARVHGKLTACVDIDDIVTPLKNASAMQIARMHTTARPQSPPRKSPAKTLENQVLEEADDTLEAQIPVVSKPRKKAVKKPHFAGWADHELKKQISAYGFKAVRKREKMIELLEKCWIEKYGEAHEQQGEPSLDGKTDSAMYGNILSNVHDISARPVPKVKKVKAPKKKKDDDGVATSAKKPRAPRASKKKKEVGEETESKPKPRKRKQKDEAGTKKEHATPKIKSTMKTKKSMLSKEIVSDSDEEVGQIHEKSLSLSKPVSMNAEVPEIADLSFHQEPTPPPTLPLDTSRPVLSVQSEASLQGLNPKEQEIPGEVLTSTPGGTPPLPELYSQVTKAIMQQSQLRSALKSSTLAPTDFSTQPRRNHQKDPTWHEKILLYDPIILEDLALWLNTEGFSTIGEDREISALEVRTWCEEKGICCLWKGGWRGNKTAIGD